MLTPTVNPIPTNTQITTTPQPGVWLATITYSDGIVYKRRDTDILKLTRWVAANTSPVTPTNTN